MLSDIWIHFLSFKTGELCLLVDWNCKFWRTYWLNVTTHYLFFSKWKIHCRKDLVQFTEKSLPGVSILKPLVNSADPSLFQNLETFFLLDYPKYEIIFCIQCTESEDSRLKMYVDSLRNKYPSVQSKVS